MTLSISDCNFEYLIPPKDVFNVKHSDHYIRHGKGKGSVRTIFANQVYDEDELAKLKEFQAMIEKEKIQLPADWTEIDTKRYMYTGKLDLKKSMKVLKQHLEWRMTADRGILSEKAQKFLTDGVVYISGRDKQYRPIVIVNVHLIDAKKIEIKDFIDAMCFVLDIARKYYFVPGKVENWVIFIEINNTGLFSIPTKFIKAIIDVTAANYTSCLDKLYILNPTSFLKRMWTFITSFIDAETSDKINMLKKADFPKLLERIDANQLEQVYGGTLPPRKTYWPPVSTMKDPPYTEEIKELNKTPSKINEDTPKKMSFNPEISDTRNLSIRQSTDEYNKLYTKQSEKLQSNIVEPIDIERKESQKMYINDEGQKIINKKSAEYLSTMKASLPAEVNNNEETETLTTQQPQPDQNGNGYEQSFGGNVVNRKQVGDDDEERTEKHEFGIYEPQEDLTDVEGGKRSQKNTHVTFGGVEVNEVSRVYSGRFGGEDGILFEKETVPAGICGLCSYKRQKEKTESCNIF